MGTKIKDIIVKKDIEIDDLKNRILVVDSFNVLYQFLTSIRQRDGTLLMDSNGNVTSHLTGLFSRSVKLMEKGLKLAFVFDGKPPELKNRERERRRGLKEEAKQMYESAKEKEDVEGMRKFAARTTVLTKEMIEEAKELIGALGLPIINAPSEGEAQAAHIVSKGDAFAAVSQDYDCLLFGVPKLVRNLTVSEKKKMPNRLSYETVKPEMVDLAENLNSLGINQDQLVVLGMLVGTDYNPRGIRGIGQKNALKLVKKHGTDFNSLFNEVEWSRSIDVPWIEIFNTIKEIPTTDDYKLNWDSLNKEKVIEVLCEKHDFSKERIEKSLERFENEQKGKCQKGLGDFF